MSLLCVASRNRFVYKGQNKHNDDSIRALPKYLVLKSFDISDSTGISFDSKRIEAVKAKMLSKYLFKVLLCVGGNSMSDASLKSIQLGSWHYNCVNNQFEHGIKNKAIALIYSSLRDLSNKTENFRELSLEVINKQFIQEFVDLLENLKLSTLKYSYLCSKNDYQHEFTLKVNDSIS